MNLHSGTDEPDCRSYKDGVHTGVKYMLNGHSVEPWNEKSLPREPCDPITSGIIGPEGGSLEIYGNILTILEGALTELTEIKFGLVWNKQLKPKLRTTENTVSATVICLPSDLEFLKPVVITLPHCLEIDPHLINKIKPVLYSSHNHEHDMPKWTRSHLDSDQLRVNAKSMDLAVCNFCLFTLALDDGSEILAKKIRIVPYATPISKGEDQKIRIHIFDDLVGAKEKIKKEEEELGGKRISVYTPYVYRENCGSLMITVPWFTPGWSLCSPNGEIPFTSMWIFDHNSFELHLENATQMNKFHCNLEIQQLNNPDVVKPSICHHVQITGQEGNLSDARREEHKNIILTPVQESTPIKFVQDSYPCLPELPKVPPLPDIPDGLLSYSPACVVRSKHPSDHQMDSKPSVPGDLSENVNNVAMAQYFFQTQVNVHTTGNEYHSNSQQHIIPLKLKHDLAKRLDGDYHKGNWVHLAQVLSVEDVSEDAQKEKYPAMLILTVAEERKKFQSLNDLNHVFEKLKRDDCVELINKYEEERKNSAAGDGGSRKRQLKSNSSSEGSFEKMDCQESPDLDTTSPDFSQSVGHNPSHVYPPDFMQAMNFATEKIRECQENSQHVRVVKGRQVRTFNNSQSLQSFPRPMLQGAVREAGNTSGSFQPLPAPKNGNSATPTEVQNMMVEDLNHQDENQNMRHTKSLPKHTESNPLCLPSNISTIDEENAFQK